MSTTVDSKVVEMRFDNKHFENNVSTTMSTLDKLKQKLGFKGATKGLEDVSSAAKKVDLSNVSRAADTVGLRFNAMYTIADQALRNITNSAMQAGKNIASALTIDPVKTGLSEYETKINAIQVIKANTRAKYEGDEVKQMADIEEALAELNDYADRTIYNYTQMTNNVGKFVAQGLGVKEATNAVQGMANLAGASGASAEDMARATYQMSQALGGTIRKTDWNSLRTANMATVELKNTLMDLARVEGIDIDGMISEKGTFEDTLEKGWLTGKLFTEAMNIYSDVYSEAELKAKGFSDDQIKNFKDLAKTAAEATTEVKTFSQLWDVLKETAQSGWTQTWELIIGDFDTAKKMLTDMQNYFSDIINGWSKARNWVVEGVLNFTKPWSAIMEKLDGAGLGGIKTMVDDVKGAASTLEHFQEVVSKVWRGDYNNQGDSPDRRDLLTKAGYNAKVVQDLVNKGRNYKLTMEDVEASHKKFGLTMDKTAESTEGSSKAVDTMTFALENLSDEQLEQAGLTKEEIKLFRDIAEEAKRTGVSFDELVEKMSTVTGRTLLIDSFKNAWSGLLGIAKALGGAFAEIFPAPSIPRLYTMVETINKFSEKLRLTEKDSGKLTETGKKLQRVFKAIFAVIDIIATVLGGAFRIAFKIVSQILDYFGINILDVAAAIADVIIKFHDWFESLFDISGLLDTIVPMVKNAADAVSEWFAKFKESEGMQKAIEYIKGVGTAIKDWWNGLKDTEDLPKAIAEGIIHFFSGIPTFISTVFSNIWSAITGSFGNLEDTPFGGFIAKIKGGLSIAGQTIIELGKILLEKLNGFLTAHGFEAISEDAIAGLVNGLKNGAVDAWNAAVQMAKDLVAKVKEFLGIHSPSTVFAAIGGFIIAGLIAGLQNGIPDSLGAIKDVFQPMLDWLKEIDWGSLFAAGMGIGILVVMNKIADALSVFEGLGDMFENIGDAIKDLGKGFKNLGKAANNWALSKVITSVAIAIGVLAGSIWLLSTIDTGKLWSSVGALGVLVIVMGGLVAGLMALSNKINLKDMGGFGKMAVMLVTLAGSLLIVALALKVLSGIEDPGKVIASMIGIMVLVAGLMKAVNLVEKDISQVGGTLIKLAFAIGILAIVAKLLAGMSWDEMARAGAGLGGLVGVIFFLMLIFTIPSKNLDQVGPTLLKIAGAIGILALVAKLLAGMEWDEMGRAATGLLGLTGIIYLLVKIVKKYTKRDLTALGSTLLAIAGAIGILALVAKLLAGMEWDEMAKAGVGILALTGIMYLLVKIVKKYTKRDLTKLSSTLLAMSAAIGIMGLTVALLGMLSIEHLAKGLVAVGVLSGLLALMIHATKGASECKGNIIAMSIAIGVMAIAIAALSFIDWTKLLPATLAMATLMGMFALIIHCSKDVKGSIGVLVVLTLAVGLIAAALYLLAELPYEDVLGSAIALSAVMLALVSTMKILSTIKSIKLGAVVTFVGVIAALYLVVDVLTCMDGLENARENAIVLGQFMMVLSVVTVIIAEVGKIVSKSGPKALFGLVMLAGVIVACYAVVGVLALMDGLQNARDNAVTLGALMTVLSAVTVIITAAGAIIAATGAMALFGLVMLAGVIGACYLVVGVLALMDGLQNAQENAIVLGQFMMVLSVVTLLITAVGAIVAATAGLALLGLVSLAGIVLSLYAVVDILTAMEGLQNAEANVNLLINLMSVITKMMVILAIVGPFALVGVIAVNALIGLITVIGVLAVAIGALMETFPALEGFLDTGIATLIKLAEGIGTMVGTLINSFLDSLTEGLPEIALRLSEFMTNLGPFIAGAKMLDESVLVGIGALAGAIVLLTAADLINGITSFLHGGASFAALGTELSRFMVNATPFIMGASLLNENMMDGVKALAATVLILTGTSLLEGLASWLTGESSLTAFGSELPALGRYLSQFATNLGTFDDSTVATVTCAANAIKAIAEAADTLPNEGGWAAKILGDNSLATFGESLPTLASNLTSFADNLGTFDEDKVATVTCASNAIKALAEAADALPNEGGWAAKIFGDNSLATFADNLPNVGTKLGEFANNLGTFDEDKVATVTCASNAIKAMADAAGSIDGQADWAKKLFGDNSLSTFSEEMKLVGSNLKEFANNLGTFDQSQLDSVDTAVEVINTFANLANTDIGNAITQLSVFGDQLPAVAEDIAAFCNKIPSVVSTKPAVENLDRILAAVDKIADANSGALATFADNLSKVGEDAVKKFVGAFTSDTAKTDLESAAKTLAGKAVSGAETQTDEMTSAGEDLGDGLVNGIEAKWDDAYQAGHTLGQKAVQGEKDGQASNSPSKLTIQAGKWLGEGLVIGIGKMGGQVYKAGSTLGETATDALSSTISRISDMVSSDIDTQPTIRPVLDLSDVRSGANALSGMLNMDSSIGVRANIGAITSMMSMRGQNGSNADIVSAIDKLNKKMDNVGNTTYQINGITYDDGSNINDAVATLVRAARIERRV